MTGSRSRVLWDGLRSAYRRLGFDAVDDRVFEYLVLARVVEPTSKVDTIRVFADLGVPDPPSLRSTWRSLGKSVEADWRAKIVTAAYEHAARHGPLTLVLYEVTTLYFEAEYEYEYEYEDKFRQVGMLKERRVDPQITVGLLVDTGGFPLEVHAFEGNKGETTRRMGVGSKARERRVVWQHSAARERRDNRTLNLQIERAGRLRTGHGR